MRKSKLTRRQFLTRTLGGAGALVALPMLDSLLPRAQATAAAFPKRLVVYFVPCGRNVPTWVPTQVGSSYDLPVALAPLAPLRDRMLVLSGLTDEPGQVGNCGDHAKGTGTVLTSQVIPNPLVSQSNVSIDQAVVQGLMPSTPFPSLQWGSGELDVCDLSASCVFTQTLSWANATTPLAPITSPRAAFDQLFAGNDSSATAAERARRQASLGSVLDYVTADANSLKLQLGQTDQLKLDEYFTAVRALEVQLSAPTVACTTGPEPQDGTDYPTQVAAFNTLMTLALQCNLTQVISYMIEFGLSYRPHPFVQAPIGHHSLSHYASDDELAQLVRVETWEAQQIANFAQGLSNIPEGNGTLLDNTAILVISEMGQGATHDHLNVAPVIIGSCGGAISTGQHLDFAAQTPLANLHVAMLNAMGVAQTTFGADGTAPLAGVLTGA